MNEHHTTLYHYIIIDIITITITDSSLISLLSLLLSPNYNFYSLIAAFSYYHLFSSSIIYTYTLHNIDTMKTRSQTKTLPTKTHEHDLETRSMALAYWLQGKSYRVIGKQMELSYSTVRNIISKFQETGSVKNKKRNGCPKKLNNGDIELLKQNVLQDRESRTMSLRDISTNLNSMIETEISQTTVRRALKAQGIKCHPAAIKPFINEINAAKRVAWCQERINWKVKDWEKVR